MKTAIFLVTSSLIENYDLKKLKQISQAEFILITTDSILALLSEETVKCFDHLYTATILSDDPYQALLRPLSYDAVKKIFVEHLLPQRFPNDMRIICNNEVNVGLAARIRDDFLIPGVKIQQINAYRDKTLMKEILLKDGIKVPTFVKLPNSLNKTSLIVFDNLTRILGLPFIIKPIDSMGTIGVALIHNFEDYLFFFEKIYSPLFSYEAEQFIEGELFHCDSLMYNGELLLSICSKYMRPGLSIHDGVSRGSIPLRISDPLRNIIIDFTKKVLSSLGNVNGASHLELFITPNHELVFLEIGARTPGALVVPVYLKTFGINLLNEDFCLQMDIPQPLKIENKTYAFWCRFPEREGVVKNIYRPKLKSKNSITWNLKKGTVMKKASSIGSSAADFLVENANYDILLEDFNYLKYHNLYDISTQSRALNDEHS